MIIILSKYCSLFSSFLTGVFISIKFYTTCSPDRNLGQDFEQNHTKYTLLTDLGIN